MTEYDVWLYKDKAVQIHRTQIKCDMRDVPGKLARIVLDYLRSAPYPGTMLAMVSVGWNYTAYLIQIKHRHRESVPPSIPMQYGRGGGMMLAGRICVRQNSGGSFRMHTCRKITGSAP